MTRAEANRLLNRLRRGAQFPQHLIDEALVATGDLDDADAEPWPDLEWPELAEQREVA